MLLRYGNYRHRVAEANIAITRDPIQNATGTYIAYRERWAISGRLYNGTGTAAGMGSVIQAFETAYAKQGQDAVLELDSGAASHHELLSRNAVGGVRVVSPPAFPEGRKGEYVSYRSYQVTLEAVIPIYSGQSLYIDFQERISIRGGGRRWGVVEVNRGPGVRQLLRTHSKCTATQSGSATLFIGWPEPPRAIWPFALVDEFPDFDIDSPETLSAGRSGPADLISGTTSWSYNFEWPLRLFGQPHFLRF